MKGTFVTQETVERDMLEWGAIGWLSRPSTTGANQLAVLDVTLEPGFGHNFHKHPQQEEVIYVITGEIEQWLGLEKRILKPGDSVFIPANMVHASFNVADETAHLLAILGPCVGEGGYELVDVSQEAPWKDLR